MRQFRDVSFWILFFLLWGFYLLAAAGFHYQQIIIGAVAAVIIASLNYDFMPAEKISCGFKEITGMLAYLLVFLLEMLKANIQVAIIVLNPKMPISPGIIKFRSPVRKKLNQVILGNSITLTPGTLTVILEDGFYYVHFLTREYGENICDSPMSKKLAAIESIGGR